MIRGVIDRQDIKDDSWESSLVAWSPQQEAKGQRAWLLKTPIQQTGKGGDHWTVDLKTNMAQALEDDMEPIGRDQ